MPQSPDRAASPGDTTSRPGTRADSRILRAVILSIGSEIVVGETRDTNAGELARSLALDGVRVLRIVALPDDLEAVSEAIARGLADSDLVVSTGGLGPTPDDLTREAIATVLGETLSVDAEQERWLRTLWARRHIPFPEANLKQAWLIPSAEAIPNPNGTAPGWWVSAPGGRYHVAMPGPPREMRAMWTDEVLPRLRQLGLGRPQATRTYRLAGIGESQVADLLGEGLLRAPNPVVATYARADAVDVRISAVDEPATDGTPARSAESLLDEAEAVVLAAVGDHVWALGDETWPAAIGRRLEALGWDVGLVEVGTGGTTLALFGDAPWLRHAESLAADAWTTIAARGGAADGGIAGVTASGQGSTGDGSDADDEDAERNGATTRALATSLAGAVRDRARTSVGLGVVATERGRDTSVAVAVVAPDGAHSVRRLAFLGGAQGRSRAAITAAAVFLERLDEVQQSAARERGAAQTGEVTR